MNMRLIDGFKILLRKSWYNYSFILSILATVLASIWILLYPEPPTTITDPLWGAGISVVVSFQYFMIVLVIASLVSQMRTYFFEGDHQTRNQLLLSIILVAVFMALGGLTALAGPYVGVALAFGDAFITAYFAILLCWNIGMSVSTRIGDRAKPKWALFGIFLLVGIMAFGGAYMFFLSALPFEQQIVLMVFPLVIIGLPIMTVIFREKGSSPNLTPLVALLVFGFGLYYTYRLVNISDPSWSLIDIGTQTVLLFYGLATTVAKLHDTMDLKPGMALTVVLLVILSRVGSQVNRLLAASVDLGDIVNIGTTSFSLVMLSILGLAVPVYWMWKRKKAAAASV